MLLVLGAIGVFLWSKRLPTDEKDYSIVQRDGQYYLVFDDPSIYKNLVNGKSHLMLAVPHFDSVKELRDTVLNGKLNAWDKYITLSGHQKEKIGVPICDFYHLYVPSLPQGGSVGGVSWGGETYSCSIDFENGISGYYRFDTEDGYNQIYASEYEAFFDRELITVTKKGQTEDGKEVTYYSTSAGEFKRIRYSLSDGKRTMVVDEDYYLKLDRTEDPVSDTVPASIRLYCMEDNLYYDIYLSGFTEKPAESWLLEFGITLYEDSAT